MTAGHVVDDWRDPVQYTEAFSFSLGTDYNNPIVTRQAVQWITHPDWLAIPRYIDQPDLALIKLADPILDVPFAVRFRGSDPVPDFPDYRSQRYDMAGFGIHGVIGEIPDRDSLLRAGSNMLERTSTNNLRFMNGVRFGDIMLDKQPIIDLEWGGSPGDSGSGVLIKVGDSYELAGITSWTNEGINLTQASFAASTGVVRITTFNDWIDSVTAVPEPSSLIILSALAPLFFWQRSNRRFNKSRSRFLNAEEDEAVSGVRTSR